MTTGKRDAADILREEGPEGLRRRVDQDFGNKANASQPRRHNNGNGHATGKHFTLKPFEAIKLTTRPNYLVKGILPRIGLAVIWGPPKCGKSFFAFDLAMHVALGWDYRGRRVHQGGVVYCALEGGGGFSSRVEAWRRRHLADYSDAVPFFLLDVPLDLIAEQASLVAAIREQVQEPPAAIFIDTVNRALVGDENKSEDMAKFIRAGDMIRIAFGCLVVLIHHCGVQGTRPRGHTSLAAADDAQIAVARDKEGIITIKVEWMKDGDAAGPMASKLERVDLGPDDDGDSITSCVIEPTALVAATEKAKGPKLSDANRLALTVLRDLTASAGKPPPRDLNLPVNTLTCSAIDWRERFYNAYPKDSQTTKQKAFVRAQIKLIELKLIGVWSTYVWLASDPDNPDNPDK